MSIDPCERKHHGNAQSVAAHRRVIHSKLDIYEKILAFVRLHGGATVHEIALGLGYGNAINRVSGRLAELKFMNPPKLKDSGLRRGGAAVLEIA